MSDSPSTAARRIKAPQDHKPAVQAEAEGVDTVDVEYNGHTFTFKAEAEDWSAGTLREFEQGHAVEGVRLLVGAGKWSRLKMDSWSGRQINELFGIFAEAAGLGDAGE